MVSDEFNAQEIDAVYKQQKEAFYNGSLRSINERKTRLKKLKSIVQDNEQKIFDALKADLGKPETESLVSETAFVIAEIDEALREVDYWAKPERVAGSLLTFPSASYIYKDPYGVALIISPWNYPFQLAFAPIVAATAAGNNVVLKPSEISANTSKLLTHLINTNFESSEIFVVEGGVKTTQYLLEKPNDTIFFTGSPQVGKIIMKAAAEQLTPVTLELGGKSPAIVDETANISLAAKKIIFGKCLNAGQTCIAPDYVLVHESQKNVLYKALEKSITDFYGRNPKDSPDYARIINENHFDRMVEYLKQGKIQAGGETDRTEKFIAPTILEVDNLVASVMQDEIFGPILPVIAYTKLDDAIEIIRDRAKPLALYLFTKSKSNRKKVVASIQFGGGTINDTVEHIINPNLPFGGIGPSGMGAYLGKFGFEAFSHSKSVLKKGSWFDLPLKYPPYGNKMKWIRQAFKWA